MKFVGLLMLLMADTLSSSGASTLFYVAEREDVAQNSPQGSQQENQDGGSALPKPYIYIQNSRHFNAQFSNLTVPAFVPTEGIYLLYSGYAQVRRKPVQHAVIRPAFVSGCIWSVGFLFMIKGIHELLGSTCCDAKIQQFWESWAILRPKF